LRVALLACVALVVLPACQSRQTGKLGKLVFSYVADDDVTDFNKPIAVGGRLDVYVRQKGNNKPVTITNAGTADESVLKVRNFEPAFFTLEALGEGNTEITIDAQQEDGEVVEDKVDMRAAKPQVLKMHHYCTKDKDAYYLTGQTIYVPYDMELKDTESVIGYGYHPIEFEPKAGLTLHKAGKNQAHFKLTTPKDAQTVTINSTIDSNALIISVVAEDLIDGARYEGLKTVLVNTKTPVLIRPTIAGKPVCQANTSMNATSKTTDICSVKALSTARKGDDDTQSWGWVEIDAKAFGKCTFEVTHLKANAKKGMTSTFTVDVAKVISPK